MRDTSLRFYFTSDLIRLRCRTFGLRAAPRQPPASIGTVRLRNTCLQALRVTAITCFSKGGDSSKVTVDLTVTKSLSSDFLSKLSRFYRLASTDFSLSVLG
jgi:hypothetical protein